MAQTVKNLACNAGDLGSIPGSGRSPEGNGNPFQYSSLENQCGQRSLAGYSPQGCRVWHDWVTKQQQISNNWGECKDKHFHSLKSTDWYNPLGEQSKSIKNLKFSTVPKDADSASPLTAIYKTAALHTRQKSSHFLVRLAPSAAFSLV